MLDTLRWCQFSNFSDINSLMTFSVTNIGVLDQLSYLTAGDVLRSIVKDRSVSISGLWKALKNVRSYRDYSHSKLTKLLLLAKMKFLAVLFGLLILSITGFLHFRYESYAMIKNALP